MSPRLTGVRHATICAECTLARHHACLAIPRRTATSVSNHTCGCDCRITGDQPTREPVGGMKHPWHMTIGEFVVQVRELGAGLASVALKEGPFAGALIVVAFDEDADLLRCVVSAMQEDPVDETALRKAIGEAVKPEAG